MSEVKPEPDEICDSWLQAWSSQSDPKQEVKENNDFIPDFEDDEGDRSLRRSFSDNELDQTLQNDSLDSFDPSPRPPKRPRKDEAKPDLGNFCRFRCPDCQKEFDLGSAITRHWENNAVCKSVKLRRCVVKVVVHNCRVCHKQLLNDKVGLRNHIYSRHRLSLIDYGKKFDLSVAATQPALWDIGSIGDFFGTERSRRLTSSVGSFCLFACHLCHKEFNVFSSLRKHELSSAHEGGSLKQKVFELVTHKCRICDLEVVCDNTFLGMHLRRRHSIRVDVYASRFKLVVSGAPRPERKRTLEFLSEAEISDDVGNMCSFRCTYCTKNIFTFGGLNSHLKKIHGKRRVGIKDGSVKRHLIKLVGHKCRICGEVEMCDSSNLLRHLNRTHKLSTIQQYCDMFKLNHVGSVIKERALKKATLKEAEESDSMGNKCEFSCTDCGKKTASALVMRKHLSDERHGKDGSKTINELVTKCVRYECKICREKIMCDLDLISTHLESRHNGMSVREYIDRSRSKPMPRTYGNKLGDLCEFSCEKCSKVENNWREMLKHLKAEDHGGSGSAKVWTKLSRVTKMVLHRCRICDKDVLCELSSLKSHILVGHRVSVSQYASDHNLELVRRFDTILANHDSARLAFIENEPCSPVQPEPIFASGAIPRQLLCAKLGNLCLYKCTICSLKITNWRSVVAHLKKHHPPQPSRIAFDHKYLVEARYHECSLKCGTIMLCDNYAILLHSRTSHQGMTLRQYVAAVEKEGVVFFQGFSKNTSS